MPTTVVSSIGTTGRDYSTLQAWEDACPANLVTSDQIWKGECYNDSEFTAGLVMSGTTTDATRYQWLTVAAGHSFKDNASVRENALFYSQANGVGISVGSGGARPHEIILAQTNYALVERLQVKRTASANYEAGRTVELLYSSAGGQTLRDCILAVTGGGGDRYVVSPGGNKMVNCLVYSTVACCGVVLDEGGSVLNCTVIGASGSDLSLVCSYFYGTIKNTALFGYSSGVSTSSTTGWDRNATDYSSLGGTNTLTSQTFANCFESTTNDFRLKSGSPLIGVGNTDATNAPNDISGTARDAGTAGDIGCWEYTAGGGGGTDIPEHLLRMRRPGVVWSNNTGA